MINENDIIILFDECKIEKRIKNLAEEINQFYKNEEILLICVLKGSVMFMTNLAKYLKMPLKMEFIKISSYGNGFESSKKINAIDINLQNLDNENVLIIEDIIDTGYTAKFLLEYITENFNPKSLKFCSLLDKKIKREVDVEPDFYGFEIDDKFLVGYGLDYKGYYRNIPYIGYVNIDAN